MNAALNADRSAVVTGMECETAGAANATASPFSMTGTMTDVATATTMPRITFFMNGECSARRVRFLGGTGLGVQALRDLRFHSDHTSVGPTAAAPGRRG